MHFSVVKLLFLVVFSIWYGVTYSMSDETNVTDAAPIEMGTESFTTEGWSPSHELEESTPATPENVTDYEQPSASPEIVTDYEEPTGTPWSLLEERPTPLTSEDVFVREEQLLFGEENSTSNMETIFDDEYLIEPRLRIERSPYTAELYLEDEFGLEFLCAGYWVREDVLLIRADCWPENVKWDTADHSVVGVYVNEMLNLGILWLRDRGQDQSPPHFANIRAEHSPSLEHCALYVLLEDDALFEKWTWASKPIAFRRTRGPMCDDGQICLRVRASAPNGWDYALVCEQSLVGILVTDRTKYERAFGRLALLDVSQAKPWIEQILKELDGGQPDDEFNDDEEDEEGEQIEDEANDQESAEEKQDESQEEEKAADGKEDQDAVPFLSALVNFVF